MSSESKPYQRPTVPTSSTVTISNAFRHQYNKFELRGTLIPLVEDPADFTQCQPIYVQVGDMFGNLTVQIRKFQNGYPTKVGVAFNHSAWLTLVKKIPLIDHMVRNVTDFTSLQIDSKRSVTVENGGSDQGRVIFKRNLKDVHQSIVLSLAHWRRLEGQIPFITTAIKNHLIRLINKEEVKLLHSQKNVNSESDKSYTITALSTQQETQPLDSPSSVTSDTVRIFTGITASDSENTSSTSVTALPELLLATNNDSMVILKSATLPSLQSEGSTSMSKSNVTKLPSFQSTVSLDCNSSSLGTVFSESQISTSSDFFATAPVLPDSQHITSYDSDSNICTTTAIQPDSKQFVSSACRSKHIGTAGSLVHITAITHEERKPVCHWDTKMDFSDSRTTKSASLLLEPLANSHLELSSIWASSLTSLMKNEAPPYSQREGNGGSGRYISFQSEIATVPEVRTSGSISLVNNDSNTSITLHHSGKIPHPQLATGSDWGSYASSSKSLLIGTLDLHHSNNTECASVISPPQNEKIPIPRSVMGGDSSNNFITDMSLMIDTSTPDGQWDLTREWLKSSVMFQNNEQPECVLRNPSNNRSSVNTTLAKVSVPETGVLYFQQDFSGNLSNLSDAQQDLSSIYTLTTPVFSNPNSQNVPNSDWNSNETLLTGLSRFDLRTLQYYIKNKQISPRLIIIFIKC